MNAYRPTFVEVDLAAIRANARALRPRGAELLAVVKADAYGHGAVPAARAALDGGATWLGVAMVEEGLELREAGIDAPVLVLSEFPRGSEKEALAAGLVPTVYTPEGVRALAEAGAGRVAVHVKVDTGMHRVGVWPPGAAVGFLRMVAEAGLEVEGMWTHFARSEEDPATTRAQLAVFLEVVRAARAAGFSPRLLHAANSAAAILHPEARLDLVRVGIALYGVPPAPGVGAGLRPALSWRSEVVMVKRLPAGEALSYGHRYRLERDANVATVPVGYADGYPRGLSSRADVLIRGRRHRVAGAVTMDQLLVDCGDDPVAPGDEVVLIGRQGEEEVTAAELADLLGTIPYEILTGIGARVPRRYVG